MEDKHERERRREADEARLAIVEAQLRAFGSWAEFMDLIFRSTDRHAAIRRLQESPFEFSEVAASYVVDLPVCRSTELGRRALEEEAIELRQRLSPA